MRKPLNLSRVTGSAAIGRRGGRKNKRQQQKQAGQETSSSHKTSHRSYPIMYCGHPDAANVGMIVVQFVARKNRALGCSAQEWTMIRPTAGSLAVSGAVLPGPPRRSVARQGRF